MAGLCRFESDFGSLVVAHFTDQDHLGRLSQCSTQSGGKVFRIVSDFALIDRRVLMRVQIFDWILDCDHVIMFRLVDNVDDCRQG